MTSLSGILSVATGDTSGRMLWIVGAALAVSLIVIIVIAVGSGRGRRR